MTAKLVIDLATLPEEGRNFEGELSPDIFGLPPSDATPLGPVQYHLHVQRFHSELLLQGRVAAPFEFTCVRTLHPFVQTIRLDPVAISLEIANSAEIDATEAIREEILLEFPPYPCCDDGDEPGHCEIDPRYLAVDKVADAALDTPARAEPDHRWAALDKFQSPQQPNP